MANMDTASKRSSAMRWSQPHGNALPPVDGSVSQGDRFHWAYQYSGIASAAVVADPIVCFLDHETLRIPVVARDILGVPVHARDRLGIPVFKRDVLRC